MEHILAEKKINKSKKQTKKPLKADLKKETNIKDLEKKVEVLQDKHIRLKAEFENFRKRKIKKSLLYCSMMVKILSKIFYL